MFSYGFFLSCLFIASIEALHPSCSLLESKLNQYTSNENQRSTSGFDRALCQGLNNRTFCCSEKDIDKIHQITAADLTQLFQKHFMPIEQSSVHISVMWNETFHQIIELMRNETLMIFERDQPILFRSFRRSLNIFFNHLRQLSSKSLRDEIKSSVEELFRQMLHLSLQPSTSPRTSQCLWQYQPFGRIPQLFIEQLEMTLSKLVQLNDLFKLSLELVRTISRNVDQDDSCFDAYQHLFICNLCTNQQVLPCWNSCLETMENCLFNRTILNDLWKDFLTLIDRMMINSNIEKDLFAFGLSLSDSLMTFLKSDALENSQIINHCGIVRRRDDIFANGRTVSVQSKHVMSFVNHSLVAIRNTLEISQAFWSVIPNRMCQSNGIKTLNETSCWTGTSISNDGRSPNRFHYDKPLSLRLQRILKEMHERSQNFLFINDQHKPPTKKNVSLTNELDDYPSDPDLEYSDYAYEDSSDDLITTTTTTTTMKITSRTSTKILSSSVTFDDDLSSKEDTHTVSYYDYEEEDEEEEVVELMDKNEQITTTTTTTTVQTTTITTTTTMITTTTTTTTVRWRIPIYHRRRPIIWNITIEKEYSNTSSSLLTSSFFIHTLVLLIIIQIQF